MTPKKATKRRTIAKPRTRLAAAMRKLEHALASDPRELGSRMREFNRHFHDYSRFNRMLILLQRADA
ncbi:MAG: hypothetical protein EXR75_16410, partial [Myxococcales bacterium]|nr:hypothetical protein [Myxococcales bacterium]